MSHMVIYRGSDGKPGYHQTDDIHDAVGFVEQMRNDQGVEHARIFRLEEVVFQYKPYYRVELAEAGPMSIEEGAPSDPGITSPPEIPAPTGSPTTPTGGNGNGSGTGGSTNGNGETVVPVGDSAADDEGATSGAKRGLFGR